MGVVVEVRGTWPLLREPLPCQPQSVVFYTPPLAGAASSRISVGAL